MSGTQNLSAECLPPGYAKYCNSATLSDVTIRYGALGELVFHGHKIVLCSNSHWFQAAFTKEFMESKSNEIRLEGDDPDALNTMFEFMYNPAIELIKDAAANDHILKILGLYEVADKYHVPVLQTKASELFIEAFSRMIGSTNRASNGTTNEWGKPKKKKALSIATSGPSTIDKDVVKDIIDKVYQLVGFTSSPRDNPLLGVILKAFADVHPLGKPGNHGSGQQPSAMRTALVYCADKHAEFGRDVLLYGIQATSPPSDLETCEPNVLYMVPGV